MGMAVTGGLGVEQGKVQVFISEPGKPHPQEFWVDRAMERIMTVADTAPQPIRDQAQAFRDQIKAVIAAAVGAAVKEQRAYDAVKVEHVSREAAAILRGN